MYVMQLVGPANPNQPVYDVPLYLKAFDPNTHEPGREYPSGSVEVTEDITEALQFRDYAEAFAFWKQESTICPTRPDGKPNRPLTSFSVSFVRLPDEPKNH